MLTREQYIEMRRANQFSIEDLFDFYQKADLNIEKIDFDMFQQVFPHYMGRGGNIWQYLKYYDQWFELLFLHSSNQSLIV